MNKRGAYFFVIDALIASGIVFIALILILSTHTIEPEGAPTLRLANEYSTYLATTKVREVANAYLINISEDGNITDLDKTLLQQLVLFYYKNATKESNTTQMMARFLEETSTDMIPIERSFAVYLNDALLYERETKDPESSSVMMSTKKICSERINQSYIYGPIILEVRVWV